MPLTFNIRQLEKQDLHLGGILPAADLELRGVDELISFGEHLKYDLDVEKQENAYFAHGILEIPLHCECVRCLKRFEKLLQLPAWTCFLPREGDEKVLVTNDSVDLTPYLREDIVLALPQHPLCEPDCGGLESTRQPDDSGPSRSIREQSPNSRWSDLDKLKL